jgi:hypothetical protein
MSFLKPNQSKCRIQICEDLFILNLMVLGSIQVTEAVFESIGPKWVAGVAIGRRGAPRLFFRASHVTAGLAGCSCASSYVPR